MRRRPLLALLALALLGAPASASDWWVDPLLGDDAASGSSPGTAWQTITYAVTAIPAGTQVVHLLPGTYDAASGEQFPIPVESNVTLVGEGPRESVVVTGPGTLFTIEGGVSLSLSTLRSLTLADATRAVSAQTWAFTGAARVRLEDVQVRDCTYGVWFDVTEAIITRLEAADVEFLRCGTGVYSVSSAVGDPSFAFTDCAFLEGDRGVHVIRQFDDYGDVEFDRCELRDQTGTAFECTSNNINTGSDVAMRDTLVVNAARGVISSDNNDLDIERSTIADHTNEGVSAGWPTFLRACIVYGNGDDIATIALPPTLLSCCIGDGDGLGANGNIASDPRFRAPGSGDYELRFDSPCTDALSLTSLIAVDLRGVARDLDGDLDTLGGVDMGCYELQTLSAPNTVALGQVLTLEVRGPDFGWTGGWLVRAGLLPQAQPTPFGLRWLAPGASEPLGRLQLDAAGYGLRPLNVPQNAVLVGLAPGFQFLLRSSASASGAAWSNPVTVTIEP